MSVAVSRRRFFRVTDFFSLFSYFFVIVFLQFPLTPLCHSSSLSPLLSLLFYIYLSFPGTVFGSLSRSSFLLPSLTQRPVFFSFLVSSSTNLYLKNKYMKITFRRNMRDTVTVAWNSVSTFFLLHYKFIWADQCIRSCDCFTPMHTRRFNCVLTCAIKVRVIN